MRERERTNKKLTQQMTGFKQKGTGIESAGERLALL
jgi:hypothetical protein